MICPDCKKKVKNAHKNRKRCNKCAAERCKRPAHNLTDEQIARLLPLVGKKRKEQIAAEIGASVISVSRYARQAGISLNACNIYKKNPEWVQEVIDYYIEHGKRLTLEKYPGIRLRSIVERYAHEKRQVRWEEWELIQLARFAGVISKQNQAAYFSRPNAHTGSIRSAWVKKFKSSPGNINGVHMYMVKPLLAKKPRMIEVQTMAGLYTRKLILWVELEKCLKKDVPEHLVSAIQTMAKFQRWLHGRNVYQSINRMLINHG